MNIYSSVKGVGGINHIATVYISALQKLSATNTHPIEDASQCCETSSLFSPAGTLNSDSEWQNTNSQWKNSDS